MLYNPYDPAHYYNKGHVEGFWIGFAVGALVAGAAISLFIAVIQ